MNLPELFKKHEDEFVCFDRVANKLSRRRDLHAFMLLDKLVPGKMRIVCAADHDKIWLGVGVDALAAVITEDQMIDLVRCGVICNEEDGLFMFA